MKDQLEYLEGLIIALQLNPNKGDEELLNQEIHHLETTINFIKEKEEEQKELIDCIHNLMGFFDTPISRMKMKGEGCEEARKIGREVLKKYQVDYRGV